MLIEWVLASYTLVGKRQIRSIVMDKEDLKEMKGDRLADNAVVIFLGALLLGQAWEIWEGRSAKLLGIFEVPNLAEFVILAIMAMFLGWSLLWLLRP